ncbi:hypothetical protein PSH54_01140 [Pseudoalteromonas sp. Angola-30]|uniref:hypothetical protein n=1 Tax=Pseudoalteromonas sp. Angola-30 TaxID=3025341 RepID=UPI00235A15E6|nr:hypothetical protein [Pseudoalteromonas sp. Angola-30]MDC9524109.1 hypothetical protein [Pseudoalteromonas sp. Angola-30]
MIDKWIAPIVIGIVVAFVSLFGSDVKEFFLPNFEITYQVTESKKLLGPQDVGRKQVPILGKKVADVYVSQVELKNTGKKAINDIEFLLDVNAVSKPELYRVFYVTQPKEMFGSVSFSDYKAKLSKKVKLKEFVEGNSITISLISSEVLNINFEANKTEVNFTEFKDEASLNDHTYVAFISALSVIVGRFLIDFLRFLIRLYRNRPPRVS